MEINEVRIPVPWGHVAAKVWGDNKDVAVLVTHGGMDNAGSFDNLIPLLPRCFFYICLDLPGHGFSSHFHLSLPIHTMDYLIVYKIAADYFKREKYILMAHSFGGQLSSFFAQIYPNLVSKIILLDILTLFPSHPEGFFKKITRSYDLLMKTRQQNPTDRRVYTYEEAVNKLINNRAPGKLNWFSAEPIARRMFEKVGDDRYVITIDQRIKCLLYTGMTYEYIIEMLKCRPIQCPVLVLLSSDSKLKEKYAPGRKYFETLKNVTIIDLNGDHDVHNTIPERVAPHIVNFLLKERKKL